VTWKVVLTREARRILDEVRDRRVQRQIARRIGDLAEEPDQLGKPLLGELAGLRSVRAAGQRYRILYRLDGERVTVLVVALGRRQAGSTRDVYELARKLLRLRLVEPG
jgi:mRNA interferase RelE/StbE